MTKDSLGVRFGTKAIAKGFITIEQFLEAITLQVKQEHKTGIRTPVGRILLEKGYMDDSQVEEVFEDMAVRTFHLECPTCGMAISECPNCGTSFGK